MKTYPTLNLRDLNLETELEKLTNEEFYYIISSLLCLGDPGFAPEKLYLSFDDYNLDGVSSIRFLFLTKTYFGDENENNEKVMCSLGKMDSGFDEIEIYTGLCSPSEIDPELKSLNEAIVMTSLQNRAYQKVFRPLSFLKGVNRILSQPDLKRRKDNDLFKLSRNSPLSDGISYKFLFGKFGPMNTDFSGNYFLVVQPDEKNFGYTKVNSFKVHDNYDRKIHNDYVQYRVDIKHTVVDAHSIQRYEDAESENISGAVLQTNIEKPEVHKAQMLQVLTDTVLSLLMDLSPTAKDAVLEDETPEELVIYCKEKYDREFDLNVDTLGIAGAHEIAWQEALAILNNDNNERN